MLFQVNSIEHMIFNVLFGGFDGSRWLNDMCIFDFPTATWTQIHNTNGRLTPSTRSCPAWAKDDRHVCIQGGYDGVTCKSDFFALNLEMYEWTEMPLLGTPPSPRCFHSCCLYGNRMYLYGGYSGNERLADMYACWILTLNHWSEVDCTHGDAPSRRSSLVVLEFSNWGDGRDSGGARKIGSRVGQPFSEPSVLRPTGMYITREAWTYSGRSVNHNPLRKWSKPPKRPMWCSFAWAKKPTRRSLATFI